MNPDNLCLCGHTYEVHFGADCSKVRCPCREFALLDAGIDLFEAAKATRKELLGATSYLATCDPEIIIQNLEGFIASLRGPLVMVEAAIRKAKGE